MSDYRKAPMTMPNMITLDDLIRWWKDLNNAIPLGERSEDISAAIKSIETRIKSQTSSFTDIKLT